VTGVLACVCALAGCGGRYVVTVGDQVARAGGSANVAIRLQRYEFAWIRKSVEGAPIRLQVVDQVPDLMECGCYTDEIGFTGLATEQGFAGTAVPVPEAEGKYVLRISLQDNRGDEARVETPVYVWRPDTRLTAVDLDALPDAEDVAAADAAAALERIAETSRVVYLTRRHVGDKDAARAKVTACAYPDGPVLTWRRSYLHFARVGPLRLPQFVRESRLVMHMTYLKALFGGLEAGLCTTASAAREFAGAGIRPVVVGTADTEGLSVTRRADWADVARRGAKP